MRILVVGAGATGGYFGGRLAQAGRDVTFLVRAARAANLREHGLRLESPHGNVTLRPPLVEAGGIEGAYDLVLVAVKAYGLEGAMADLAPAMGPGTTIVPLLNGMRHVDRLRERFGEALVGGVCKVATRLDPDGHIVQLATFQELAYGEFDGRGSERVARIDEAVRDAGFTARATATIAREMWEKWVLLAAMGGVTCLMRGTLGEVVRAPGGAAFASALLEEVIATVEAVGERPTETYLANTRRAFADAKSGQASSMYRDLVSGGPVETDQILGDLVARAAAAGVATPLLAAAHAALSVYEERRRAASDTSA